MSAPMAEPSRSPITAWIMIAILVPIGGWLAWEIERTIGLGAPRFVELLRDDRVFDLAMLDFFVTAGWVAVVLLERIDRRDWRLWLAFAIFCAVPSLGIAIFILLDHRRRRRAARPES